MPSDHRRARGDAFCTATETLKLQAGLACQCRPVPSQGLPRPLPQASAPRSTPSATTFSSATAQVVGVSLRNSRATGSFFCDLEQGLEVPQRLLAHLAAVVRPQLVEFAPGMYDAARFSDAALERGLVAREAVGHQRALACILSVLAQDGPHVLAAAGIGEVEHHGLVSLKRVVQ
jgi:hypothetical protein